MRKLSLPLLAQTVRSRRKAMKMTQAELADAIGMSRTILSNLETRIYTPSVEQMEALAEILGFDVTEMFIEEEKAPASVGREYKIAVAGVGYVGLSLAVLLAQHHEVTAVCTKNEKAEMINSYLSPIQDEYIEKYLQEAKAGKRELKLRATVDGEAAYKDADFILLAVPTNYDPKTNYFDCSAVEDVLALVKACTL